MKVEQLNLLQIDWTKPQVVVSEHSEQKFMIITNHKPFDENSFSGYEILTGCIHDNLCKNAFKHENATSYPIELKLTIESDFELCNLLHRLSIKPLRIDENIVHNLKFLSDHSDMPLYNLLEELANELKLFKNN